LKSGVSSNKKGLMGHSVSVQPRKGKTKEGEGKGPFFKGYRGPLGGVGFKSPILHKGALQRCSSLELLRVKNAELEMEIGEEGRVIGGRWRRGLRTRKGVMRADLGQNCDAAREQPVRRREAGSGGRRKRSALLEQKQIFPGGL